ncbi:autophagy-related protein 2 homolog B [Anopheles darlingi]|uniref:autophagy-related protein 2 homolog B n=1 Tax=Anopheles darlingi TaxID=43151 RepID=UPI0020FFFDB2|nr:autophagy-related protein 2 homolog B [Anopheles darlingi]XP_049531978.1 autophagy-related protein 2 homolog B [Anopheles darlingi]XP_049531979.1 autophagy-related protein 2 homolog B [Anopheles darlingi]XP_049531980.1 autophagy-related protein 2 homolog B [Anopheles darlingi]XP_049531982.1 autophagy-related protein 2 homolog B [Anopheles darlingi]XP_049531983.1 autophagy-related protein 2 homolog B [Anopheles darlingi]XP_049531984.1 autophagy-related protein 2 homolog B [Anopheles darling
MPWYAPWSDVIKKKICRFLLQRYLGRFLEEKLTLDQLNVDFYNGTGTVHNVTLYCQALNELCEGQGWGVEVTGGHIGSVTVNVPYDSLLAKDSSIEVSNLTISLRPKARPTDGTSMLESMWSSMSSSMQLAQEYLERESTVGTAPDSAGGPNASNLPPSAMEGLENFAQIIDNVLNRIKAKLFDTEIRIEYLAPEGDRGVAVIVKIKSIDYQNEAGNDPPDRSPKSSSSSSSSDASGHTVTGGGSKHQQQQQQKSFLIATHATHHITIEGITFYTEEFRIDSPRLRRQRTAVNAATCAAGESMISSEQFLSTISNLPETGSLTPTAVNSGTPNEGEGYFSYSNTSGCDSSSTIPSSRGNVSSDDDGRFYQRSDSSGTERETDGEDEDGESDEYGETGLRVYPSGEIIIGKITSKQEIRLKMKQADNLPGPNVELELSVGSIQLFVTPRQLHSLVLLCDGFLGGSEEPVRELKAPGVSSGGEMSTARRRQQEAADLEFQQNMTRMGGGLGLNQGWSLADPMQTMIQEQAEFLERDFRDEGVCSESLISSSSSMTSSFTSSSTLSRTTSAASRRRMIDPDANADISKFNVRVAAIALVLLHDDLLLLEGTGSDANVGSPLSEASVQQLQTKADRFFRAIGNLGFGLSANDIQNAGLILDSGCDTSHLRLLLAPIILEGDEQRNRCGSLLRFSIAIARADFREVLPELSVPLVEFHREPRSASTSTALPKRPEISVSFEQSCNALRGTSGKRFAPPRTKIHVTMAPFVTEFDITILDRLNSALYQAPFASYYHHHSPNAPTTNKSSTANPPAPPSSTPSRAVKPEPRTELQLESLGVDFRLRFPIPDLRPIHDPQRVPWWQRNVRPDYLLLKLEQVRTVITLNPHPLYDISANAIKMFYCETEPTFGTQGGANGTGGGVNIGKTVMQENASPGQQPAVEYPRIRIELPSEESLQKSLQDSAGAASGAARTTSGKQQQQPPREESEDSEPTSGESFGVSTGRSKEDTPFSAKRVCRESDTPHSKTATGVPEAPETLTLPGDSDEMDTFCSCAMKRSKLQIRIDLPVVSLQLKSKHLYEVIYNRISTDLLLWEPSAPTAMAAAGATGAQQQNAHSAAKVSFSCEPEINLAGMGMMDSIYMPYTMCQSGIQLDSSSSASNSETESDSDGIFYSVYDRNTMRNSSIGGNSAGGRKGSTSHSHRSGAHGGKLTTACTSSADRASNTIAFRVNIGQGILTMFAPVRDAQKHVIPGQLGEFVVRLNSGYIFSVNGFRGNTNLGYLCIQAKSAEFYHCGLIPTPSSNPPLRLINSVLPSYLQCTLYPTPKGLTLHEQRGCTNREMLSLAIQIKSVPDLAVKRIRMAAGIQLTTLRHHSTLPAHAWLTQLLDMLDVEDYPVAGYTPLGVVTEMHLHLWDCAIDYRPLYFPYRAIITIGSFMISSNITTASSGLTLNFIAEDVTLSLAPQLLTAGKVEVTSSSSSSSSTSSSGHLGSSSKITVLPSAELVCVVEVGLFEISLMLNERVTIKFPKFDLRTAINDVHVRTCADSARALAQLIGYLAAEGDLLLPEGDGADLPPSSLTVVSSSSASSAVSDQQDTCGGGLPMGSEPEGELLPVRPASSASAPVVTPKQQQRVNTLMADAMEESLYIESTSGDASGDDGGLLPGEAGSGVEVFFFPDEDQAPRVPRPSKTETINPVDIETRKPLRRFGDGANKRRFGSDDDSLSIDDGSSVPSSFHDDDQFLRQRNSSGTTLVDDDDSHSVNMRELLNFECSVLGQPPVNYGPECGDDDDVCEALPQVTMDLGDVSKLNRTGVSSQTSVVGAPAQRKISSDTDDDFCIIADEERPHQGTDAGGRNQEVPVSEGPIRIVDNHFSVPSGKPDLLKAPEGFPSAVERYTVCEMTVTWHIYGGNDFLTKEDRRRQKAKGSQAAGTGGGSSMAGIRQDRNSAPGPALPMSEAYKSGVSYSKGSPSVSFVSPASAALAKLTWKTRGGQQRSHDVTMEIHISKVQFSHESYPNSTKEASRQVLLINELEIVDGLAVSNIKKFLYHPRPSSRPSSKLGASNHHMVVIKALHVRPNPALPAQECCLRVSVLPIRLNIDQDSLLFLINYFNQLGGGGDLNDAASMQQAASGASRGGNSQAVTPAHQPPIMTVESLPEAVQELQAKKMVSENLMLLIEEEEKHKEVQDGSAFGDETNDTAPIYFRHVIFSPDVPIRIDYHGKRMELSHGSLAGLLMGLGQLQCSEIRLKKISYRHGLLGVDRLLNFLLQEWLQDIKKHQLPKIIGGFGPMYSLVQLFQGVWDLFWLPIEQYQKDGRIVRGLQRGAQSFTARTALAMLEITTRIIHLLQITAETAYDMISPGPSIRRGRGNRKGKRKRLHPPQDIREGMSNAIQIVREGISETAHNLVEITALEHDQKGYTGAVGAVMRQIPPIVVQPIVLATQATSNVLGGVKNQLVPDARAEAREKYKDDVE